MNALDPESSKKKLVMWHKVNEKKKEGLKKAQIARELGLDVKTVRRYLGMSLDEFMSSGSYKRMYIKLLDPYESRVYGWLDEHADLSSSQIHDWLRERYSDLPKVNSKTVYNYVKYIRAKYGIPKPVQSSPRQYCMVTETDYGEYAQADFGEAWMQDASKRKLKVYFFVMVLCRSRKKYVWLSKTPFTSELAIYAHEKAFEYYGGKPKRVIYDQDAVLIHSENFGDYVLTKSFNAYVNQSHFQCVFCHKSDPESKGKVENAVKYVKYNFLRGRTFVSIEQLNEEAERWLSRTANGLPHNGTRLIPDEVFKEEKRHLAPYCGTPEMPQKAMKTYKVQKDNTIHYKGSVYSLPAGSYKSLSCFVWVNVKDNTLEIYDGETGKQMAVHPVSSKKGQYISDSSHKAQHHLSRSRYENAIMDYCDHDRLATMWLDNLQACKPRYYIANLRLLSSEIRHFEPTTLHRAFEKSLDCSMYNAKDFIALCERIGKRIPVRESATDKPCGLPDLINEVPEKTDINLYSQYFK